LEVSALAERLDVRPYAIQEGMHVLVSPEIAPVQNLQVFRVPRVYSFPEVMAFAKTGQLPNGAPVVFDRRLIGSPTRHRMLRIFSDEAYATLDGFCVVHPTGPHGETSIMLVQEPPTDMNDAYQYVDQVPPTTTDSLLYRVGQRFRKSSLGIIGGKHTVIIPEELSIGTTYGPWCSFDGLHFQVTERPKKELRDMETVDVHTLHPDIANLMTQNTYGQETMLNLWNRIQKIADRIGIADHEVLSSGVLVLTLHEDISLPSFLETDAPQVWRILEKGMRLEWKNTVLSHDQTFDPDRMCGSIVMRQLADKPVEIRIGVAMQMEKGVKPQGGGIFAVCERVKLPSQHDASIGEAVASHIRGINLAIDMVGSQNEEVRALKNARAILESMRHFRPQLST
jgi:hypothetical protein